MNGIEKMNMGNSKFKDKDQNKQKKKKNQILLLDSVTTENRNR